MERHFTLPISIAAALHAGVFFGFHRVPAANVTNGEKNIIWQPEILPTPEPPEEMTDVDRVEEKTPSTTPLPRSAENYTAPQPTDIVITRPPLPEITTSGIKDISQPVGIDIGSRDTRGIIDSLHLDNPPHARAQTPAQYPFEARRQGMTGEVLVEFVVDERGRVISQCVARSSDRIFDEAALRAVAKWRFEPGRANGRVVRFRMMVPIVFSLNE
jgi:protein TonB